MSKKIIMIEGIPGSGKSSLAKYLEKHYSKTFNSVRMYTEGDLHPLDLAWCAYLTRTEFDQLIKRMPEYKDLIIDNSDLSDNHAVIAYTKLGYYPNQNPLMTYCAEKEIYHGSISFEQFRKIHMERWASFVEKAKDGIYIFECIYFQNHIVELLGSYELSEEDIINYLSELVALLAPFEPELIYLEQDEVETTINRVAEERISEEGEGLPDWIDLVIDYIEELPYSQTNKLEGHEGVIRFFEDRKQIELNAIEILNELNNGVICYKINNSDYNLEKMVDTAVSCLSHNLNK